MARQAAKTEVPSFHRILAGRSTSKGRVALSLTLTVVIPASDEPLAWIQDVTSRAGLESDEVLVVLPNDSSLTSSIPIGPLPGRRGWAQVLVQSGDTKADALNLGLRQARGEYVVFIDADVKLRGGEITSTRGILDRGAEFVGAAYGQKPPPFPIFSYTSGWFFGARRDVFLRLGGWKEHFVEDVATIQGIKRAGHRVWLAPFSVELRRAPRNPLVKLAASMFA